MEKSAAKSLLDMPNNVLLSVLRNGDIPSIQCLRKVCRNLRDFVDNTTIKYSIPKIYIRVVRDAIIMNLHLGGDDDKLYPDGGLFNSTYKVHPKGCMVSATMLGGTRKRLVTRNKNLRRRKATAVRTFFDDLNTILNYQKEPMEALEVILQDHLVSEDLYSFSQDFKDSIRSCGEKWLAAKALKIEVFDIFDDDHIVEALDPEHLRKLELVKSSRDSHWPHFRYICETEQWRRIKELEIRGQLLTWMNVTPIACLHLSKLSTGTGSMRIRELTELVQKFFQCGERKHFRLTYITMPNPQELSESFGPHYESEEDGSHQWFYRVPDETYIFQMLIIKTDLELKYVERSKVPMDAVVLDRYFL